MLPEEWNGDLLELSSMAECVWIGGEEQSPDTRQHRLFERYRSSAGSRP